MRFYRNAQPEKFLFLAVCGVKIAPKALFNATFDNYYGLLYNVVVLFSALGGVEHNAKEC